MNEKEYCKKVIFYVAIVFVLGHIGTTETDCFQFVSGCSSGVEHNLAKVGVVGSNPIARSKKSVCDRQIPIYFKTCVTNLA